MSSLPASMLAVTLMVALATGCSRERGASEPRATLVQGDFGDLEVAGELALGEEGHLTRTRTSANAFRGLAFRGRAGAVVRIEVSAADGDAPEAVLIGARATSERAHVLAHGRSPLHGTVWFQLLRDGTHYVTAREAAGQAVRVRVTEVLPPAAPASSAHSG